VERDNRIKKHVKRQYAAMAAQRESCCSGAGRSVSLVEQAKAIGYSEQELESVPTEAVMGMGCGNPTALAELRKGETVLDLGCGGGLDAFLAAQRVGETGKVIGVDMTPEMIERARRNAARGDYQNVEFHAAEIESLPLEDDSTDVILSNCVINHSPDKPGAFKEAFRVLRPGGRMLIADLVIGAAVPEEVVRGLDAAWAAWFATCPLEKQEYLDTIGEAGFRDVAVVAECAFDCPGMDARLRGNLISIQVKARKRALGRRA
jgi:SAM-dependent methyltransferase